MKQTMHNCGRIAHILAKAVVQLVKCFVMCYPGDDPRGSKKKIFKITENVFVLTDFIH